MPLWATCVQTFIPKIVSVPAQAVPLALLSFFGFVAPVKGVTQDQPARVKMFIQVRATASRAWLFPPLPRRLTTRCASAVRLLHPPLRPRVD